MIQAFGARRRAGRQDRQVGLYLFLQAKLGRLGSSTKIAIDSTCFFFSNLLICYPLLVDIPIIYYHSWSSRSPVDNDDDDSFCARSPVEKLSKFRRSEGLEADGARVATGQYIHVGNKRTPKTIRGQVYYYCMYFISHDFAIWCDFIFQVQFTATMGNEGGNRPQ